MNDNLTISTPRIKISLITKLTILLIVFYPSLIIANLEPSTTKLKVLYNSLDPNSISQHLAFYDLYKNFPEGKNALQYAYQLLSGKQQVIPNQINLPPSINSSIQAIIGLVNKHSTDNLIELADSELAFIDQLAKSLPNRFLKGYHATNEEEVLALPPSEIDLARGILLSQIGSDPESLRKIKSYEAAIDLMALQILARINLTDDPKTKIRAINRFVFEEMGFRFPPHSTYAKDVDLYTFLPSVLDSRRGVCLGVSTLYICLAQRLDLKLEIVTPPGHIYVRWHQGNKEINIETTARGIDLPSEEYLGIDTRFLQERNIKETIGMAHFNQASVFWERGDYDNALNAYLRAKPYLPNDELVMGFISFIYILKDQPEQAEPFLKAIVDHLPDHAVSKDTVAEDYLMGNASKECIQAVFMRVDENRESIIAKCDALQNVLKKYPHFRDGYFSLASTWMQLHRSKEALEALERYHEIDSNNASVEYYLAELYADRLDYNRAWKHLRLAEKLTKERDHEPKALLALRQQLVKCCPE
jgi:tetratricopeptide (TPR) repeat protein